jgi:hypothetical protein
MRTLLLLFISLIFFGTGCVHYYYAPNSLQTPYIEKKGDGVVTAAISGNPRTLNGDFHASYSPIKQGTVMLNYFHTRNSFENTNFFSGPTYVQSSVGYLVEAAVGGYRPIAFGTGALYMGWGLGEMQNNYGIDRIADIRLQRFFVQPTFTFKTDWFRLGMGMRLVRLSFPSGNIDYRIEPSDIQVIQNLDKNSPFWFPEFGGNLGFHFKPVTISLNLVLLASQSASEYGFDSSNMGLGISIELQELFKKKKIQKAIKGDKQY